MRCRRVVSTTPRNHTGGEASPSIGGKAPSFPTAVVRQGSGVRGVDAVRKTERAATLAAVIDPGNRC